MALFSRDLFKENLEIKKCIILPFQHCPDVGSSGIAEAERAQLGIL